MTHEELLALAAAIEHACRTGGSVEVHAVDPLNPRCGYNARVEIADSSAYCKHYAYRGASDVSAVDALRAAFTFTQAVAS